MNKFLLFSAGGLLMVVGPERRSGSFVFLFQKCKHKVVIEFCTRSRMQCIQNIMGIIFGMKNGCLALA